MKTSAHFYGITLSRLTLALISCGFWAHPLAASASILPDATLSTGSCTTSTTADTKTCSQSNPIVSVFSQAQLSTLTATANIDQSGPYSTTAQASVHYYMELSSSSGFPNDYFFTVPILVLANGYADVGSTVSSGSSFNHNTASASVTLGGNGWYACAGYGCYAGSTTSFSGGLAYLKPGSSASGYGGNIFDVIVSASVTTNSNFSSSYAHAWADPTIQIDPTFLAANPQYSLSFSSNLPAPAVPVPAAAWLFGSGLIGLAGAARKRKAA